jgi:hypothetical protein
MMLANAYLPQYVSHIIQQQLYGGTPNEDLGRAQPSVKDGYGLAIVMAMNVVLSPEKFNHYSAPQDRRV